MELSGPVGQIVTVLLLVIYVLVKDIIPAVGRRRNNKGNPGYGEKLAKIEQQWEEQYRTNKRFEGHFKGINDRLDTLGHGRQGER